MRLKSLVLASTSVLVLGAAAPAFAQTADPAPAEQQGPTAEEEPAIVVTGIRESLRSSQSLKRNSDQILDSIVAEDIGKLPDIAVSDTAARIPGVQVERAGGEASRVLVRGLPDFTTTYNSREIFTAEERTVALQDFPSGFISGLEVFKATTAELVEPGLAGLINVRTRRPLDFDGFEIAGSLWALYTRQADKVTPNGNLLITNRWDTGIGEIGALLNASYTNLKYLDSERSNTDFVADPTINGTRVRFPDVQRLYYRSGERERPSLNGSLQWRPSPGLEFYADGLWQGFRNKIDDHGITVPLWGASSYSDIALRPGTNLVQSGTAVNPFRPDGFQGGTYNKTDTYQFAVGGSYESGGLRIRADVARTESTFTGSTASVDYMFASPQTVRFNTDVPDEAGGSEFDLVGFDAANPANYMYRGFYEEAQQSTGQDWQARLDVSYDTGVSFLNRVEAGVRYVDRDAHREFGNRYGNFESRRIPISQVPLDYELFDEGFRGSDVQPFRSWLAPTYSSIRENLVAMRRFTIGLGAPDVPPSFGTFTEDTPTTDPTQTFDANEKSLAGYFQTRYEFGSEDGIRVDGVVGLRIVRTEDTLSGTSTVAGVQTPVSITRDYVDWLPNASARIRFNDQINLRLSATQTRTRPTFRELNPSANLGAPGTCAPGNSDPFACARIGSGGNPYLNPFTSNNYDASLEYYFSRNGFASAAVFRRDLAGFIQPSQARYIDPVLGPVIINGSVNLGRGQIDGAEAQLSTFFDFGGLPSFLSAFGVQANVTYLDAQTDGERILGLSKWTYNVAGLFESGGLSARLSYNWRSDALVTLQDRGDDLYREMQEPISRLDFSTNYGLTDKITVFFDWTNILAKPYESRLMSNRANAGESTFPRFVRYEETTFSLGTRFRF